MTPGSYSNLPPPPPYGPPQPFHPPQLPRKRYDSIAFGLLLTLLLHLVIQSAFLAVVGIRIARQDAILLLSMFGVTQIPYMLIAGVWALVTVRVRALVGLLIGGSLSFLIGFTSCIAILSGLKTH